MIRSRRGGLRPPCSDSGRSPPYAPGAPRLETTTGRPASKARDGPNPRPLIDEHRPSPPTRRRHRHRRGIGATRRRHPFDPASRAPPCPSSGERPRRLHPVGRACRLRLSQGETRSPRVGRGDRRSALPIGRPEQQPTSGPEHARLRSPEGRCGVVAVFRQAVGPATSRTSRQARSRSADAAVRGTEARGRRAGGGRRQPASGDVDPSIASPRRLAAASSPRPAADLQDRAVVVGPRPALSPRASALDGSGEISGTRGG